jgi:uncharacterized protein YbjT (DUF2867 family)
MAKPLAPMGMG